MDVLMLDELSSFTCTYNQNMGYIFCIYYCITQTLMKVEVICQTIPAVNYQQTGLRKQLQNTLYSGSHRLAT